MGIRHDQERLFLRIVNVSESSKFPSIYKTVIIKTANTRSMKLVETAATVTPSYLFELSMNRFSDDE